MHFVPTLKIFFDQLSLNQVWEKLSHGGDFYFSSEAAESMLIRQLIKNAEYVFFIFKKGPLQHRDFSKNFQKFCHFSEFSKNSNFFPKIILEANIMQGYKKITPPKSRLKLRYCASDLLSHINFALSGKKKFSIFY